MTLSKREKIQTSEKLVRSVSQVKKILSGECDFQMAQFACGLGGFSGHCG